MNELEKLGKLVDEVEDTILDLDDAKYGIASGELCRRASNLIQKLFDLVIEKSTTTTNPVPDTDNKIKTLIKGKVNTEELWDDTEYFPEDDSVEFEVVFDKAWHLVYKNVKYIIVGEPTMIGDEVIYKIKRYE